MLIASSFIHAMRTEINIVGNSVTRARLDAAATAGVHRAVLEIMKPPQFPDRWNVYGVPQAWTFQGVPMQVSLLDESAKIDINVGNEILIRGLLRSQGASEEEAAALMDAILDWRDPDTLKRLKGAEEADYAELGLPIKPANAPFQSIEELQLVVGMTPALYQRLAPWITIYSRQGDPGAVMPGLVGVFMEIGKELRLPVFPKCLTSLAPTLLRRLQRPIEKCGPLVAKAIVYAV